MIWIAFSIAALYAAFRMIKWEKDFPADMENITERSENV